MKSKIDKGAIKMALIEALEAQHRGLVASHRAVVEGVSHEENRPENDKDTRSTEASYLARGQAARVAELEEELARVRSMSLSTSDVVQIGSYVEIASDRGVQHLYVALGGGGVRLSCLGKTISVITPASPMGRALVGQSVGDEIEIAQSSRSTGGALGYEIVDLA